MGRQGAREAKPLVQCHTSQGEEFGFPRSLTFLWLGFRQRTNKGLHLGRGRRGYVRSQRKSGCAHALRAKG